MNPNEEKKAPAASTTPIAIKPAQVKAGMAVVCSNEAQFGVVDHMQGPTSIKLKQDAAGTHHYIPLAWITRADDNLHADRPGEQAMKEWATEPPKN